MNRNTISGYETGRVRPSALALNMLATLYETSVEWFFGEDDLPSVPAATGADEEGAQQPSSSSNDYLSGQLREIKEAIDKLASRTTESQPGDRSPATMTGAIHPVEVVELAAAAGGGAHVLDESPVGRLWFREDWLMRQGIDPILCSVITVRGESMEPTLPDGCSILVDRSQGRRRRRVGRILVLRTDDGLVVKRVGKDEDGRWEIQSDHPGWETVPWTGGTEIIGEVRWYGVTV